jgi:hypothetical protein
MQFFAESLGETLYVPLEDHASILKSVPTFRQQVTKLASRSRSPAA